jgi:hypothetical protein
MQRATYLTSPMAQRVFISCRSHHDPIVVANLACSDLIDRAYTPKIDYMRWAGNFNNTQNRTKCQVLVDCRIDERLPD